MKIGIMQPYFLPYIGYWQLLNTVDYYVIYDDVNFIKRGWINRNNLLMDGKATRFNIQIQGASQNKLINESRVSDDKNWKVKLLKTIENCYKKAPYYENVYPIINEVINFEEDNLSRFIENSIKMICNYLKIDTKIIISSELRKNDNLKGQDKIIDICKIMKADEYYNAIGGKELYSEDDFKKNGIKLRFLKTQDIKYKQFGDEFIPNLSILDVIMFNSVDDIKILLQNFELI